MRTGLHANQTRDHAKILDYYRRSGSKVFKTLTFDTPLLDALASMGVTIIGRVYEERQRLGGDDAKRFLDRVLDSARRHPRVSYWEGHNEAWHKPGEIERYAEREIERMKALEAIGKRAVIGNFAVGTPDIEDGSWALFRPALEHAASHGHALGLHEYAGPYMQYMVETPDGRNQWDHAGNRWTGFSDAAETYYQVGLTGWLTLRYRKVYRRFLVPWGLGALPLFITEGGIDNTSPRPGGQGAGWKDFEGSEFAKHTAVGDYAEQRRWYMWQVSHDAFVKGVVDFGWDGTATGWASFDLAADPAMVNRIIAAEADLPVGHHAAEPAPAPSPAPAPGVVDRPAVHRSSRAGERASWIVVHSTDTPVGGSAGGTVNYLADNPARVSIHELVVPGTVYRMVLDSEAAHHAGNATLPDGTTGAAVNRVSWGIEIFQIHGQPCAPDLVDVAARRITEACRRLGITDTARIVGHREIDPGRRSDPVGVDMGVLRARVLSLLGGAPAPAPGVDVEALKAAARAEHARAGVRLNGGSAIQRTMLADGAWPTTNEATLGGITYARGESHIGGAWLYWWENGKVRRARL